MPGGTPATRRWRRPAVVPGAAAQAAQGRADAGAADHPGRGRRGRAGGLRHREPHREPLLHRAGHRPGRQEHDPGVLLRPADHQRRRLAARGHRQDPDHEDRRAWCGHDGRRIAYVSAKAGYDGVLKDVSIEAAQKGKAYSEGLEAKALKRGKTTPEKSFALPPSLRRPTPPTSGRRLRDRGGVREPGTQAQAFQEIEDIVEPNALLGSNTSTLPITGLATGVKRQEDFIGIHFFLPVDKKPLASRSGEKTSYEALARASDYTLAIGRPRSWSTTAAASSPAESSAPSATRRWPSAMRSTTSRWKSMTSSAVCFGSRAGGDVNGSPGVLAWSCS